MVRLEPYPSGKEGWGVRPIAVGDTFRRLVGKVLLKTPLVQAQAAGLRPRQTGVGVPMACDLIAMGVQSVAQSTSKEWVVLQVDLRNAFNSVDRHTMLEVARTKVPSTYNWLAWCYSHPCPLYCQGKLIAHSSQGVHQGDAMGPLGFSLGLERILDQCALPQSCLEWTAWYLDDGVAVGSLEAVSAYLNALHEAASHVGLSLNLTKCQLWGPGTEKVVGAGVPYTHGTPLDSPIRAVPIVRFADGQGITVLGCPVDSPKPVQRQAAGGQHTELAWTKAVDETALLLSRLRLLPEGQLQHTLLRHCLDACKVNHMLRTTPCTTGQSAVGTLSDHIRRILEDIVGCPLSTSAWAQATMPITKGGMGVRDPVQVRPAARMAALVAFTSFASCRVGLPSELIVLPPDTGPLLDTLTIALGGAHEPTAQWKADWGKMALGDAAYAKQTWWADQLGDMARARLSQVATIRDITRLHGQEGPLASAWLSVVPGKEGQDCLSDVDFRSLSRFWLGIPVLPVGRCLPPCPACGEALDPFGDHLVGCKKNLMVPRHHALRDQLCDVLQKAGLRHKAEVVIPPGGGRVSPFALERPADILLIGWDRGRDVAVDLTFSHPLNVSCHPLSREKAKRHLTDVEHAKKTKEGAQCTAVGWGFHPAAFSPWGGAWGRGPNPCGLSWPRNWPRT